MFHKSILSALVIAAGVGVYAVVKTLSEENKKKTTLNETEVFSRRNQ